jgi:hypothetical protein
MAHGRRGGVAALSLPTQVAPVGKARLLRVPPSTSRDDVHSAFVLTNLATLQYSHSLIRLQP